MNHFITGPVPYTPPQSINLRSSWRQLAFPAICMGVSLLTACGGGGGAESSPRQEAAAPPPPPPPFTMSVGEFSEIGELSAGQIQLAFSGAQGDVEVEVSLAETDSSADTTNAPSDDNATVVTQPVAVSYDSIEQNIVIEVFELDNNAEVEIVVSANDQEGRSQEAEFSVALINTSGDVTAARYAVAGASIPSFIAFTPEQTLLDRVSRLLQLTQPDDDHQVLSEDALSALIDPALREFTLDAADAAAFTIDQYREGELDESQMTRFYEDLIKSAESLADPVNGYLQEQIEATNGLIPEMELPQLYVDVELGLVSQFIGNPTLGEYQDTGWVFSAPHAYLEPIVFAANQTCVAE